MAQRRSRTVLTSGGLEPVLDTGSGGHSVFAQAFLRVLAKPQKIRRLFAGFDIPASFGYAFRAIFLLKYF